MSKKVGLFLCPKGGGYANGIQNATLTKIDEAGEKLQNIGSSVENVGKEVPAGDCRCFFQCEHQCFNDGRDVQVLCAYRQCAGVLGRGSVRSYLPCSSS